MTTKPGGWSPGSERSHAPDCLSSPLAHPKPEKECCKPKPNFPPFGPQQPPANAHYPPFQLLIRNVVQAPAGMSCSISFCQANSGCAARCAAAWNANPHACPAATVNDICSAMAASVTLFCTAPAIPCG